MTKQVYFHDWAEDGESAMLSDFGITKEDLDGATILVASYTYEDYSGDAYVLFERGGKLWEVHGGHCSCYGLSESSYSGDTETQWKPEETFPAAIRHRLEKGTWGEADKLKGVVFAALAEFEGKVAANDNSSDAVVVA